MFRAFGEIPLLNHHLMVTNRPIRSPEFAQRCETLHLAFEAIGIIDDWSNWIISWSNGEKDMLLKCLEHRAQIEACLSLRLQ